jgi:hypothetical protein
MTHILVPHATLQQVLDAYAYHIAQTRPIERSSSAIDKLRALLNAPSEPKPMTPVQVRDGIADWIDTNINHREFWTPDVVELIRSIEINGQGYTPKETP